MTNIFYRILAEIFGRTPKKPTSLGSINSIELEKLIPVKNKKDGIIYLNHPNKYITDYKYKLCSLGQISDFLFHDNVSFQKFREETNDCDNFAIQLAGRLNEAFPGFAVGFAMSDNHAFNIFVDYEKQIWFIEPQTDKIFSLEKAKKDKRYYPLKIILI